MLIFQPLIAKWVGMSPAVAGAWLGGTIDTTGAVVAAGAIAGPQALQVAVVVKMAQNVLIGFAAFFLAIWFTFKGQAAGQNQVSWRFGSGSPSLSLGSLSLPSYFPSL